MRAKIWSAFFVLSTKPNPISGSCLLFWLRTARCDWILSLFPLLSNSANSRITVSPEQYYLNLNQVRYRPAHPYEGPPRNRFPKRNVSDRLLKVRSASSGDRDSGWRIRCDCRSSLCEWKLRWNWPCPSLLRIETDSMSRSPQCDEKPLWFLYSKSSVIWSADSVSRFQDTNRSCTSMIGHSNVCKIRVQWGQSQTSSFSLRTRLIISKFPLPLCEKPLRSRGQQQSHSFRI